MYIIHNKHVCVIRTKFKLMMINVSNTKIKTIIKYNIYR
jgi:hypothetical protein